MPLKIAMVRIDRDVGCQITVRVCTHILNTHMYKWQAPYLILDDFLDADIYTWCCEFFRTGTLKTHPNHGDNWHQSKNRISVSGKRDIQDPFMQEIYDRLNDPMLKYLETMAPHKIPLYQHTELQFIANGAENDFPIHNDTADKLLSAVIYLAPQHNRGTVLYSDHTGNDPYQVEWQPNRAFIFSRTEHTWHSYSSDGVSTRQTLIYNLRGRA